MLSAAPCLGLLIEGYTTAAYNLNLGPQAARAEVYGFTISDDHTYLGYDWSQVTRVAWKTDRELIKYAHSNGGHCDLKDGLTLQDVLGDEQKHVEWVNAKVEEATKLNMDGLNFDLEVPIKRGSPAALQYTALVQLAADVFHSRLPGSKITVDVPWSPYDVDGRNYDWLGLAAAADLLFIMAYDTQSQIPGRCIASANSPLDLVRKSVRQWLDLGVPRQKLVLGLPWYGYDYVCSQDPERRPVAPDVDLCRIDGVPFMNSSCSDAAGRQVGYAEIMAMLHPASSVNTTNVRWDETQQSPYFNYRDEAGTIHQVWFDNPESLRMRYRVAMQHGLAGVGVWNLDCLDYSSPDPRVQQQTADMWEAMKAEVLPSLV